MNYTAIIADLVASSQATPKQRTAQQRALFEAIDVLNARLLESLVRPIQLTAGDEVQALVREPSHLVVILQFLEDSLREHAVKSRSFAFGVGYGEVTTSLDSDVRHMDGPCFHRARAALEWAAKKKIWAAFSGFEEPTNLALNGIFDLMGAVRDDWTDIQAAHTVDLRLLGKRIDVAEGRDVSPSVVTESLQAAHFDSVRRAEVAAVELLSRLHRCDSSQD
jgi:hypothetical protein